MSDLALLLKHKTHAASLRTYTLVHDVSIYSNGNDQAPFRDT